MEYTVHEYISIKAVKGCESKNGTQIYNMVTNTLQ